MNTLDISAINTNAPYSVWNVDEYYFFRTKYGALYKIGFMPDDTIWDENAYQFLIVNENNTTSPNDAHFYFDTVSMTAEGVENFAAIIVQKSNPKLQEIIDEFNSVVKILANKPE